MNTPRDFDDQADRAVADRLGRLRTMPVDTARLDRLIEAHIPRPTRRIPVWGWAQAPLRAVAAAVLILGLVGLLVWSNAGGPVMASTAQMAQFHRDMVSGKIDSLQVDSIAQAGRVLSDSWPDQPGLPQAPPGHVMACCMREIKDKKVACVLLRNQGQPVTLSVARASDLRSPTSPTVFRDGQAYCVQTFGELNMVSTQRDGRWICLMGELPSEQLIAIAHGLRFDR